jgi:uncharacterized LabA/DUF88 family protein
MIFNAYVDGFNLYKGALETRNHLKWLDLPAFCQSRRPEMELGEIYYFTARIKRRFPNDKAPERQHAYLRVLANQGVKVVEGKFRKDENWLRLVSTRRERVIEPALRSALGLTQLLLNNSSRTAYPDLPRAFVWEYGEKGSDVNLASHLLKDVFVNKLAAALVVSGDSDLSTPILMAKEFGVDIKTVIPNKLLPGAELKNASTFLEQLHISDLSNFQMPRSFITPKGRSIIRPQEWDLKQEPDQRSGSKPGDETQGAVI